MNIAMWQKLIVLSIIFFYSCEKTEYIELRGETMGTYYQLKYFDTKSRNFQVKIDSILQQINQEMSTYIPDSYISQFNSSTGGLTDSPPVHFMTNYHAAYEVNQATEGMFDPTVMPLVNYWGFGYTPRKKVTHIDTTLVDSLNQFIGMDKTFLNDNEGYSILSKTNQGVQLDFSAIAKGYAVDFIAEWLEQKFVKAYLVEIGGELRTSGKNPNGNPWVLGINTPARSSSPTDVQKYVQLSGQAMASSGNYRNFYEENGRIFSHTINPKTGFPERTNLLAVSIVTGSCMMADAYATSCMVMGLTKAKTFITSLKNVEACLFFAGDDGEIKEWATPGFNKLTI